MSRHLLGAVVLLIGVNLYGSPAILPMAGRLTLGRVGLALGFSAVGFVLLHAGFSLVGDAFGRTPSGTSASRSMCGSPLEPRVPKAAREGRQTETLPDSEEAFDRVRLRDRADRLSGGAPKQN